MWKAKLIKFLKEDGLTVAIVLLIIGVYAFLRTPGDQFDTLTDLKTQMQAGHPTVIEFYSNTCSICLISKPKVAQLERELPQNVPLLRLNVKDPVSNALAAQWRVVGVPTFVVLDGQGAVTYFRAGAPQNDEIQAAVTQLLAATP